ncbi:MAG: TetR/AcrR family transcriptional regulator [Planctomycetes bacterium]|nr:TetR/AcrR family transcriptional regulator [Planctomycetota bacterium]
MKLQIPKKLGRPADPALSARRQEEILDVAAKLFAEHGYSGTDTQDLADQVQVGKGTLYRYFSSKEDLFLAAVDRVMRRLLERVESSIAGVDDPLDRIEIAIQTYLGFFEEHPGFVELLIQERAQFKDRKKPTYFRHREANVEKWRDLYRGLIAAGRVRKMSVERITDVISQTLYGTIFVNYFAGQPKPSQEQARDILDVVFHGILAEGERKRRTI